MLVGDIFLLACITVQVVQQDMLAMGRYIVVGPERSKPAPWSCPNRETVRDSFIDDNQLPLAMARTA